LYRRSHTEALAAKLAVERARKGPRRKTWYGSATAARYGDDPVQIAGDGSLAIAWRVSPTAQQFLADIAGRVTIAETASTDYNWRDATTPETETAATTLGRMGDSFAVIRLLRRKYGVSLADAKAHSEDIRRQP